MNIATWVSNNATIIDKYTLKFKINGENNIPFDLDSYILSNNIKNLDLSGCNLKKIPDFVFKVISSINYLNLNNNNIQYIPNYLMDMNLNKLEKFEIYKNPIKIKESIFINSRDFIKNIYSLENKNYMNNNRAKYNKFIEKTDKSISNYIFNLYNDMDISYLKFDQANTDNLIDLINIHKTIKFENYDYINNNNINKFLVKSIFNFLYQLSKDPLTYNIKSININDVYELNNNIENIFQNDNLRKKFMSLVENIFLSEFLFNDENAIRLLGRGSYNIAYELSEEYSLYIIKQLINLKKSKYESYKEFLISTILMFNIGNIMPNFTDPICIFNLDKNETKTFDEVNVKNNDDDYPKYLCNYDEKYYLSNSQYIFDKKSNNIQRKTFFNKSEKKVDIDNYYMTRNVEYGIGLDKYLKTLYKNNENEINTKILNIILQIIRSISVAYCKVGFYHGDGHCQNIMINKIDQSTYIEEFYNNPYLKYKYHKTDEIVVFIDYGMSNLYINKMKKDSPENIITHLSISSHDEMANPIVDIHRSYYSIMCELYTDLKYDKANKNKILHIIKLFYIYLGGFFYEDKRINYNSSLSDIESIIRNDSKVIFNKRVYEFTDYDSFNFGYFPNKINGVARDQIHNCFDIYNYFFSQYLKNIKQVYINDKFKDLSDNIDTKFYDEIIENSTKLNKTIKDAIDNKDNNIKIIDEKIRYKVNKNLEKNDQYKEFISDIINSNDNIYAFVEENLKSILLCMDNNNNKINQSNYYELNKSFEYITKALSIYINNIRKLCYYNIINKHSNNLKLDTIFFNPSKINNLIKQLLTKVNKITIPKNTNINNYIKIINDYYEILSLSSKLDNKDKLIAPKPKGYTYDTLKIKTVKELKDIYDNLKKINPNLSNKCVNTIKKSISKFVKDDYINCILYIVKNL